jgi:hypothetical protein
MSLLLPGHARRLAQRGMTVNGTSCPCGRRFVPDVLAFENKQLKLIK